VFGFNERCISRRFLFGIVELLPQVIRNIARIASDRQRASTCGRPGAKEFLLGTVFENMGTLRRAPREVAPTETDKDRKTDDDSQGPCQLPAHHQPDTECV